MNNTIENILETGRIYNPEAARLLQYARKETNRIKAYKMIKVSKKLEQRYRESRKLWLTVGVRRDTAFVRELEYNVPTYIKVRKLI